MAGLVQGEAHAEDQGRAGCCGDADDALVAAQKFLKAVSDSLGPRQDGTHVDVPGDVVAERIDAAVTLAAFELKCFECDVVEIAAEAGVIGERAGFGRGSRRSLSRICCGGVRPVKSWGLSPVRRKKRMRPSS